MTPDHFVLDAQLQADTFLIAEEGRHLILLMNNALVPWFIVVPCVQESEWYRLSLQEQETLWCCVQKVATHIAKNNHVDKMNIASIGNIVRQMHVHVVGRKTGDFCWPQTVWGQKERKPYTEEQVKTIRQQWQSKQV